MQFIFSVVSMSYELDVWQILHCSSTVSLRDTQGHVGQEFIQSDVSLRGEFRREQVGDHQEKAVSQDLHEHQTIL